MAKVVPVITHASVTNAAANPNVLVDGPKWDSAHTVAGLANLDDTADADKPVSTATAVAIALKANLAGGNSFTGPQSVNLAGTSGAFDIISDASGTITPFFQSTNYSGSVGGIGGAIHGQIARGTAASPLAPIAGDSPTAIGGHVWIPGVGWSASSPAAIYFALTETQSATNNGAQVNIYATPIGDVFSNRVNALTVDANSFGSVVSVNAGGHTGTLNARLNIVGPNAAGKGAELNFQKAGTAGWFIAHGSAIDAAGVSNNLVIYNNNTTRHTVEFGYIDDSVTFAGNVTLKDTLFTLQDDGDATKLLKFQLSGITTATTRTITVPDANITLARSDAGQTFTGTQAFGAITATTINGATLDNLAWTAYSPTPTAGTPGTSVLTLNSARYKQIGKTVILQGDITVTTAGTGSGIISMPLPFTAAAFRYVGAGIEGGSSSRIESAYITPSATAVLINDLSGAPVAFANGQRHIFTITYEVP